MSTAATAVISLRPGQKQSLKETAAVVQRLFQLFFQLATGSQIAPKERPLKGNDKYKGYSFFM